MLAARRIIRVDAEKGWPTLRKVAICVISVAAILVALHFPYDVDQPLTDADLEVVRKYYADAYKQAPAVEAPPSEFETKYLEVATERPSPTMSRGRCAGLQTPSDSRTSACSTSALGAATCRTSSRTIPAWISRPASGASTTRRSCWARRPRCRLKTTDLTAPGLSGCRNMCQIPNSSCAKPGASSRTKASSCSTRPGTAGRGPRRATR